MFSRRTLIKKNAALRRQRQIGKKGCLLSALQVRCILFSVCVWLSFLIANNHTDFNTLGCDDLHAHIKLFPMSSGDQIKHSKEAKFLFKAVGVQPI